MGSTPQPNQAQPHVGHVHFPPGQLPPQIQQVINSQIQALVQQQIQAAQSAVAGQLLPPDTTPNSNQARQWQQSSFPQIIAQQQQARAAAGLHGLGGLPRNGMQGNSQSHMPPGMHGATSNTTNHNSAPTDTNRTVRENQGPNGEWRVVVETTSTITNNHNIRSNNEHSNPSLPEPSARASPASSNERSRLPQTAAPGVFLSNQPSANGSSLPNTVPDFQQHLSALESTLASGTAPAESIFQQAQAHLTSMANQQGNMPPGIEASLRTRLDNLSTQADQLRTSLTGLLMRVVADQRRPAPVQRPQEAPSSTVYVLSSPNGPQALLVSPSGLYGTPWLQPGMPAMGHGSLPTMVPQIPIPTTNPPLPTVQPDEANAGQPLINNPDPAQDQQVQHQQQQQQQANQARELLRILIPLGGHLWLFIRLFGFVYFFTAGGSYRRAILLGLCAFLVFIAQTGIFRPVLQHVWEPLRRHAVGLLPIGTNDQLERILRNDQVGYRIPPEQEPTVENAQRRILELEQRIRATETPFRSMLRRVERAIALFIASLVPGVGERHMAARGAAETLARHERGLREAAEEHDREERERLERREQEGPRIEQSGSTGNEGEGRETVSGGPTADAGNSARVSSGDSGPGEGSSSGARRNSRPLAEI